ncbi:methyl-accepting chemotaxis protein [Simplicispira psychrophila]|uniref:methyl-accepting chemotaxis protein n=1 Tax=Simplicispira psychrophila TaxID=80882 RepID=UPI00048292E5|nr:Tar ligand binding domain-containing protein [Simplicispira psychrophila]
MKINLPVTGQEQRFPAEKNMVTKTNTKGIITFANKDFVEISGFAEEELIGKNHNLIRHPDMPPIAFEIMWKTLKRGFPWHGIVKNRCKNGDHYWVDARIVPIKKNGEITGYMSVRSCPAREDVAAAEATYKSALARPEIIKEKIDANWKKHLSIKNGIPLWILFVTLLMIGGGILGITGLNMSKADIQAMYHEEMVPVQAIQRMNFLMADNRAQVALALNFKFGIHSDAVLSDASSNNYVQHIAQNKNELNQIWANYIGKVKDPKEKQLADNYIEARMRYVNEGLLPASEAIEAEDYLQAQRVFFTRLNPLYDTANTRASTLLNYLFERGNAKLVDTTARGDLIFRLAVAGISLSCLVLVVAGFFFFRITARPLEKAVLALEDIAEGNLSDHIEPSGYGEPGRVMNAVMVTQMHLKVMLHEIRQSSDSIHQQCHNLNQVMMNLAEHSDEQQDRIHQTVDAVNASRAAMATISSHMDALLDTVHADDDDALAPVPPPALQSQASPAFAPTFELMPAELLAVFGDSLSQPPSPAAAALPEAFTTTAFASQPAPTALRQQLQTTANAARSQALGIKEMSGQLQQVARLIVQNSEDVQGAWAASQQLQQTARELDELVQYFD